MKVVKYFYNKYINKDLSEKCTPLIWSNINHVYTKMKLYYKNISFRRSINLNIIDNF